MKVSKSLRVIVAALGILSVISTIHATESGKMDATRDTVGDPCTCHRFEHQLTIY